MIELNGKRYDALSGVFLGEGQKTTSLEDGKSVRHRGRSIDGFVKPPKIVNKNATQPKLTTIPVRPAPPEKPPAVHIRSAHRAAKHTIAHQPERAKTLMRHAVSKPHTTIKPALKAQLPTDMMAPQPAHAITPKLSVGKIDPRRKQHAQAVSQSAAIKKFGAPRQFEPLSRPAIAPVRARAVEPAPPTARAQTHSATVAQQPTPDIFEAAIAHATSHEQPLPAHLTRKQRARRRLINGIAGVGAVLLIGSFIAYMNMASIELRVASLRAGFHATLPNHKPSGYALDGRVSTHNNQVTISFHSDSGNAFKLTQQASNWNSATLFDNIVAITGSQHQTLETGGRTIYLYNGGSNATWVNGGIWYQISGNAALTSDQITDIATSM